VSLELEAQSSSRNGAAVLWVTIHTAEGPTDEFPSRPDLDAGSAEDLLAFFQGKTDRSCHAIADDDKLLDGLVDYARAAWTLRNGNPRSDNLEMCGLASWSRAEWLTHKGMLANAARWVAGRLKARQMPVHRVTVAECAARSARGYMDHNTYTQATKDGTHWDVGPNFPWDVFGPMVTDAYNGTTTQEDDGMSADPAVLAELQSIDSRLKALYDSGFASRTGDGKSDPTHMDVSVRGVNQNLGQMESQLSTLIVMQENNGQTLASILEVLQQIAGQPAPTP